jgi:hypothetical protein
MVVLLLFRNIVKIAISSRTLESESMLNVCFFLLHKKDITAEIM